MKSRLKNNNSVFKFNVPANKRPLVERELTGSTFSDRKIDAMVIPVRPGVLRLMVKAIRYYQRRWSAVIGRSCLYEPSCSHYCELALREYGILKGAWLTLRRLRRCDGNQGGIDMTCRKEGEWNT